MNSKYRLLSILVSFMLTFIGIILFAEVFEASGANKAKELLVQSVHLKLLDVYVPNALDQVYRPGGVAVANNRIIWAAGTSCLQPTQEGKEPSIPFGIICWYDLTSEGRKLWGYEVATALQFNESWSIYTHYSQDNAHEECQNADIKFVSVANPAIIGTHIWAIWDCEPKQGKGRLGGDIVVTDIMTGTLEMYSIISDTYTTIISNTDIIVSGYDVAPPTVVWVQAPKDTINFDIVTYNIDTQQTHTITNQPAVRDEPRLGDNVIVWRSDSGIFGYDLTTNAAITVSTTATNVQHLEVSGEWVVWQDGRYQNGQPNMFDIYAANIATGDEYRLTTETGNYAGPDISNNLVVWQSPDFNLQAVRILDDFTFLTLVLTE